MKKFLSTILIFFYFLIYSFSYAVAINVQTFTASGEAQNGTGNWQFTATIPILIDLNVSENFIISVSSDSLDETGAVEVTGQSTTNNGFFRIYDNTSCRYQEYNLLFQTNDGEIANPDGGFPNFKFVKEGYTGSNTLPTVLLGTEVFCKINLIEPEEPLPVNLYEGGLRFCFQLVKD